MPAGPAPDKLPNVAENGDVGDVVEVELSEDEERRARCGFGVCRSGPWL